MLSDTPSLCQLDCPRKCAETSFGNGLKQWPLDGARYLDLYARCQRNTNVLFRRRYASKVSHFGSNSKEYCVLNDGFYLYKTTMIVFSTLYIPLWWRTNKDRLFLILNFRRVLNVVCFFWVIPGVWILYADVSEHCVPSS